jgi:hypothetical protein
MSVIVWGKQGARVEGVEFWVYGLWLMVDGLWFMVYDL